MIQLPCKGQLHYNADTNNWEIYNGLEWRIKINEHWEANKPPWQKWWAWKPVKDIHGRWQWCKTIYRRQPWLEHNNYPEYEYGTIFDILKEAQ